MKTIKEEALVSVIVSEENSTTLAGDQQEATSLENELNARPSAGLESADGELDRILPSLSPEIEEQHEEQADSNSWVDRATASTDAPMPETSNAASKSGVERATASTDAPLLETSNADSKSGVERATTSTDAPLPETSNADSNCGFQRATTSTDDPLPDTSNAYVARGVAIPLRRSSRKKPTTRWLSEGDMLAALGKDSLLSVRGVCALYRKQSSEEKFVQRALERNHKGFSIADAKLASCYAKFMLGERTHGDIQRSVHELDRRYLHASDRCISISMKYSKQLFRIYEEKEDPFFHP